FVNDSAGVPALAARIQVGPRGGVIAELTVVEPDGRKFSRRIEAPSCAAATDALALVVAITLDPSIVSGAAPKPAPPPPPPPPPRDAARPPPHAAPAPAAAPAAARSRARARRPDSCAGPGGPGHGVALPHRGHRWRSGLGTRADTDAGRRGGGPSGTGAGHD